jgi:hypothetical protein
MQMQALLTRSAHVAIVTVLLVATPARAASNEHESNPVVPEEMAGTGQTEVKAATRDPGASIGTTLQSPRAPLRLSPLKASQSNNPAVALDWTSRPRQLAITVGVPFYDDRILHGDITVDARYGYKVWWLVPYVSVGFRQARMDPTLVPDIAKAKKLEAWHVTFGVRLQIPASRQVIPFVGVAGELAYWGFTANTHAYCHESFYPDAWRCYEHHNWKPGRAIKAQIGILYKPEPNLALEFWVERGFIDAPEMFTRTVSFYNPALGVAWHH